MVIRSLYQPVYQRDRRQGLPGAAPQAKPKFDDGNKTFEEYLTESFQGEVVQNGAWFAPQVSELSRKNLQNL
jgi:hypothetical protein